MMVTVMPGISLKLPELLDVHVFPNYLDYYVYVLLLLPITLFVTTSTRG